VANGLEMLYNAIGGAGSTLSGHLRETELNRLAAEAAARSQAERDAMIEESNRLMADIDRQYAERTAQAQELGIDVPKPGTIDDQIFRATGGFARSPAISGPGASLVPGGGTQIPVGTPRTEWAPSQAEAAVSADTIRASKDLLSGRPSIDMSRYLKRLEAMQGLALKAGSRPSTKDLASIYKDQQKEATDFMTREGAIRDEGRKLQGTLDGRFFENRAQSARDRQSDAFREQNANQRAREQNALQERIAKDREESKKKDQARLEAKELRLQAEAYSKAGQREFAQKLGILAKMKDVEAGDLSVENFKAAFPDAKTQEKMFGGSELTGYDFSKMIQDQIDRTNAMKQYNYLHGAEAGIAPPAQIGKPVPTSLAQYAPMPNLNDLNNPRVFGAQKSR